MDPDTRAGARPRRRAAAASWVVLLFAGTIGAASLVPPAIPRDGDAASGEAFSAARAFDLIRRLAREPHPIGTPENQRVRSEIVTELKELGLDAETQIIEAPDYFGGSGGEVSVVNVLVRIPGTTSTGAVALVGHYDTVPSTPGANDDTSAVAVMLETARAILAGEPLRNDLLLVFTDGEEPAPRFGSMAFVTGHPWMSDITFVINLEALGYGGPSVPIAVSGPGRWVIDQFVEAAPHPVAYSYLTATAELIGGSNTDFAPFRDAGVAGIELAYLHGSTIYHTEADAPDRVSLNSLYQHGANTLALMRHLGTVELILPVDDPDAVFSTVAGIVVRYPATWGLPLALLAGAVWLAAAWRRRAWPQILLSAGFAILVAVGSALAAVGVWSALAGWRTSMGMTESYLYLAGLAGVTVGIAVAAAWLMRTRVEAGAHAAGVVAVWWGMGLLTTLAAPGIGYLFTWPALAGSLALLWRSPGAGQLRWQAARFALVAGLALALVAPAIDTFYQLAQPRPGNPDSVILSIIAIPALLLALLTALVQAFRVRPPVPGAA